MIDFAWFGLGGFITSIIFAALLEWKRAWWEPDWIISVLGIVLVGVSYTGGCMYLFTRYGIVPNEFASPRDAMQWINWHWVYMFLWTGTPMGFWRASVFIARLRAVGRAAGDTMMRVTNLLHERDSDGD